MVNLVERSIKLPQSTFKTSKSDLIFSCVNYAVLSLFMIVILYPLIYVVSASFSSPYAVISGKVWLWPVDITLDGYKAVFKNRMIWVGFKNSFFYVGAGTLVNVAMTILAAYPLSRNDFKGRHFFMLLFTFTMMFSGGLIPSYLIVKDLHLLDSRWAMIIPTALSVWNVIITRTYFRTTIPNDLLEAAQLDGCTDFQFLKKIVIPLSGPILAVISLFYAVGHWNQFFNALLYLKSEQLYPLQLVLRGILVQNQIQPNMLTNVESVAAMQGLRELLKYSLIVVSTFPLLIVYPFVQKHFVKGMMVGSLKG
jgi:putative aldouronate transport system permease protein